MENIAVWKAVLLLVLAFYFLARSSSWLVDGAVGIAERLRLPKLLIGIVLVGFATSAPEFMVSFLSALAKRPGMALGNAVGSNVVNDGVALALVGIVAAAPVVIPRRALVQAAAFLAVMYGTVLGLALANGAGDELVLPRWGGGVLLGLFFLYLAYIIWDRIRRPEEAGEDIGKLAKAETKVEGRRLAVLVGLFVLGLALVICASHVVVKCAIRIATAAGVSDAVIALSMIAIGTSIPEIATCVAAARKGQGSLAVGNILGSDIFNIAGVVGASAVAHPLAVKANVARFMFPAVLVVAFTTLGGLVICRRMTRGLGIVLLAQYAVYLAIMLAMFVFKIELW